MQQLDIQELKTIVKILHPEIISSPAFINMQVLKDLGFNVLTGIQYKDAIIKHVRRGGTGRAYKPGVSVHKADLGALVERELEVKLSKGLYPDNIQLYREKVPFEDIKADINAAQNTRIQIDAIEKQFSEDLLANIFLGKWDPNADDSMHMMDGICTILQRFINTGEISTMRGNLQPMLAIDADTDPKDAYAIVKEWTSRWSTKLKAARRTTGVDLYLTDEVFDLVQEGYLHTYEHRQMDDIEAADYQFLGMRGIHFKPTCLLGHGSRMIATIPGNFDFGLDSENDMSSIKITEDVEDPNFIFFHVQSATGTRVRFIESDCLCINDQSSVADETLLGDFQKATLVASANDPEKGSVTYTGADDLTDLPAESAITLTAIPKPGFKFEKWSDDVTVNPRLVITNGTPRSYQAVFVAEAAGASAPAAPAAGGQASDEQD